MANMWPIYIIILMTSSLESIPGFRGVIGRGHELHKSHHVGPYKRTAKSEFASKHLPDRLIKRDESQRIIIKLNQDKTSATSSLEKRRVRPKLRNNLSIILNGLKKRSEVNKIMIEPNKGKHLVRFDPPTVKRLAVEQPGVYLPPGIIGRNNYEHTKNLNKDKNLDSTLSKRMVAAEPAVYIPVGVPSIYGLKRHHGMYKHMKTLKKRLVNFNGQLAKRLVDAKHSRSVSPSLVSPNFF